MRLLGLIVMMTLPFLGFSQNTNIHVPLEIQKAVEKGTRSTTGAPGENYWHNTVDYNIEASIDPSTREISGSETIKYYNNSPDPLNSVVIRLYYDVFKKGNKRGMQVNEEDISDGTEIGKLMVAGVEYNLENPQQVRRVGTNMIVNLSQPLGTDESLELMIDWKQKVPLTVRRTGAIDPTSFFVAYWYPQVAVYDDIFGWDGLDYTFETEFYNNLANFDVKITAPEDFLVWATGELQNEKEILPKKILDRYEAAKTSTETIHVVDSTDLLDLQLLSGTWHYTAEEVSDFAFAISDHYQWDAASQKVEDRDVLIGTAFPTGQEERYKEVTAIQQKTMKHFSQDIPGIPYPYPAFTTFIGLRGGGMEFPMMANNAGPGQGVTIHELFHTYFPMYVRINERRWAWMDEGWADFNTTIVTHKFFENSDDHMALMGKYSSGVSGFAGSFGDLPTYTSSQNAGSSYGYQSYPLPSFTYALLYDFLGEEEFIKAYRTYIKRWAKKSPTPHDFFWTFEDVSGKDLTWLWDSWYFNYGYSDVAIEGVDGSNLNLSITGGRLVPVFVKVTYKNDKVEWISKKATEWSKDNMMKVTIPKMKKVEKILVNGNMVDVEMVNNFSPSLKEIYEGREDLDKLAGEYKASNYPVTIKVEKVEGKFKMSIPEAGLSSWLLPTEKGFTSIDENILVNYPDMENPSTVEVVLQQFGVTISGSK